MLISQRTVALFGLFLLGAAAGVGVHFAERVFATSQPKVALPSQPKFSLRNESDEERSLRRSLGFGRGLAVLLDALEDPGKDGFRYLRSDFLQRVPNYSTALLPPLKERAMEQLIKRFSAEDWRAWPKSHLARGGKATEARLYVDQVFAQNRELGLFLETAALLLNGLFLTTEKGMRYDLREGFDYVVSAADELLTTHQPTSLPAKFLLSYSVPTDPAFVPAFEKERSRLVANFVHERPTEIEQNIRLLSSLDGRYSNEAANQELENLLLRVSQSASVRMRAEILKGLIEKGSFNEFFLGSPRVKRAAAQLVAVASVDALEARDLVRAKRLLNLSLTLAQGLPSQRALLEFFHQHGLGSIAQPLTTEPSSERIAQSRGFSISPLGLAVALLGLVGMVLAWMALSRRFFAASVSPRRVSLGVDPELVRSPNLLTEVLDEEPRKVVNFQR